MYAGIPPTKTCINCHAEIWTNAEMLEPVRQSWATGESIKWTRVHDLPDYVYFNHEIHVNKGMGCASCHGRVDEMPIMYQENTLQMEWCLNCHRNPGKNIRPTSEIYNMAWAAPSSDKPVYCADTGVSGPTAQGVTCSTEKPKATEVAFMQEPTTGKTVATPAVMTAPMPSMKLPLNYVKFTSQEDLGKYLVDKYHIRTPNELSSCEVCHR
jgi:hypothetical protein